MKRIWLMLAVCLLLVNLLPTATTATPASFLLQAGTRWETVGCVVDSGVVGPTALILGGVHGK